MSTTLKTTRIDPEDPRQLQRFDDFVRDHPKGHILQTAAWGDLKARTGWRPLRYVVEEPGSGRVRAALSVLLRKLPLPGVDLTLGYAPRGPVMDLEDEETLAVLARDVGADLRRRGAVALKIDPDVPVEREEVSRCLRRVGFARLSRGEGFEGVQPRFVFRLWIGDRTPEELLADFHPKTRYNIRLAERKGVAIRTATGRDDLDVFYRVLVETAVRDGFLIRARTYYEDMWDILVESGLAQVFLAEHEGDVLAGAIAFLLGDKAWYVYGASSNTRREVMPNYLLQWTMVRWAIEKGCRLYDFRGVSGNLEPTDPLYGLYRFKKGFAADFTEFVGEFDLVLRPVWYLAYRQAEPAYRRLRARLRPASRLNRPGGGGSDEGMA